MKCKVFLLLVFLPLFQSFSIGSESGNTQRSRNPADILKRQYTQGGGGWNKKIPSNQNYNNNGKMQAFMMEKPNHFIGSIGHFFNRQNVMKETNLRNRDMFDVITNIFYSSKSQDAKKRKSKETKIRGTPGDTSKIMNLISSGITSIFNDQKSRDLTNALVNMGNDETMFTKSQMALSHALKSAISHLKSKGKTYHQAFKNEEESAKWDSMLRKFNKKMANILKEQHAIEEEKVVVEATSVPPPSATNDQYDYYY